MNEIKYTIVDPGISKSVNINATEIQSISDLKNIKTYQWLFKEIFKTYFVLSIYIINNFLLYKIFINISWIYLSL